MSRENAAVHLPFRDSPSNHRPMRVPSPVLSRLTSLRNEVRSLSKQAQSVARYSAAPGTAEYRAILAQLVDNWIRASKGRRRLLCLGSAAELNVLRAEHIRLCEESLRSEGDEALRVLFWTSARRHTASLPRLEAAAARQLSGGQAARAILCEACAALRLDARRCRPHPGMHLIASPASVSGHAWYRCATCAAQWLRHKQRREFIVWTPNAGCV